MQIMHPSNTSTAKRRLLPTCSDECIQQNRSTTDLFIEPKVLESADKQFQVLLLRYIAHMMYLQRDHFVCH